MVEVLSEGFQDLQWFWKELHRKLPSDELLKLAAEENSKYPPMKRPIAWYQPRSHVSVETELGGGWGYVDEALYGLFILRARDGYRLTLNPTDVEKRYLKNYPTKRIELLVTPDFGELTNLSVKHNDGVKGHVLSTDISTSGSRDSGLITSVFQTARDETYFKRTRPRFTKNKPQQLFHFRLLNNGDFEYAFNYWSYHRHAYFEGFQDISRRWSYLPYPGFSLPQAILNVCSFRPAVLTS